MFLQQYFPFCPVLVLCCVRGTPLKFRLWGDQIFGVDRNHNLQPCYVRAKGPFGFVYMFLSAQRRFFCRRGWLNVKTTSANVRNEAFNEHQPTRVRLTLQTSMWQGVLWFRRWAFFSPKYTSLVCILLTDSLCDVIYIIRLNFMSAKTCARITAHTVCEWLESSKTNLTKAKLCARWSRWMKYTETLTVGVLRWEEEEELIFQVNS